MPRHHIGYIPENASIRVKFRIGSILIILMYCILSFTQAKASPPELPLANTYKPGVELGEYWASEKLDGVRAYWNGEKLISKQGNTYHAPEWFLADFPKHPLDGELWIARNSFERVMTIVRDQTPGAEWRDVRYMVFDLPTPHLDFTARLSRLKKLLTDAHSPYIKPVEQFRLANHKALMDKLDEVVKAGGEGLMLHKGSTHYKAGRSNDLLKVKTYEDAEAHVIAHLPGKGKYTGMLGALLVETEDNTRFRIGTGFSDRQRREPPPIGSLVTFKYYGKTSRGVPRFASFLRIREQASR
ncbi:DNA ligase [Pseudomonadota bacterium]